MSPHGEEEMDSHRKVKQYLLTADDDSEMTIQVDIHPCTR